MSSPIKHPYATETPTKLTEAFSSLTIKPDTPSASGSSSISSPTEPGTPTKVTASFDDLDADLKGDWDKLKERFLVSFPITVKDTQTKKFELRVMLSNLEQKETENISDYLDRCEDLSMKLPTDDIDVDMATLKGMRDSFKRERVSFECNKDDDYSFTKVKRLIKAAYIEIGKISPFDLAYRDSMGINLSSSYTGDVLLKHALINTTAAFPAILQGIKSLNITVSKGITVKQSNAITDGSGSSSEKKKRDLWEIKCCKCGGYGHYQSYHDNDPPNAVQAPIVTANAAIPRHQHQTQMEEEDSTDEERDTHNLYIPARCALPEQFTYAMAAGQTPPKPAPRRSILQNSSGVTKQQKQKSRLPKDDDDDDLLYAYAS
ncbi:MAG: hypothetical protein Q9200_005898 [Gallowayella weberi]